MTSYVVTSGQTSTLNLVSGDSETVFNGGTELNGSVSSALLSDSGAVSGTTVTGGGFIGVRNGGATTTVVLSGSTISSTAVESVSGGGLASSTIVNSFSFLQVTGSATSSIVNAGGAVNVSAGGVETGATVSGAQASLSVSAGGVANLDQINSGGLLNLFGGSASGTIVTSGGSVQVSSGGTVTSATLTGAGNSGGAATIFAASGTTVLGAQVSAGGATNIYGSASGTVVFASGFEFVSSGGTATAAQVGGSLVTVGGTTTVSSGVQIVFTSGTTISTQVGQAGKEVLSGGTASSTAVTGGGGLVVQAGGLAMGATVSGSMVLSSGGVPVTSGSFETVSAGGVTSNTTISSGGLLDVKSTGVAQDVTVNGGSAFVSAGATATGVVVNGGMLVLRGATVSGAAVSGSGLEVVSSGGNALNTTIGSGATQQVKNGGSVTSTTLLSGATLDLSTFSFLSSGLGSIDSSSDILTISQGGQSATVQLAGNYTSLYFSMVQDGGTGTDVIVQGTPCYCPGTLILTATEERPVEALQIGDEVLTHTGQARPIRWIGRRSYAGRFAAGNRDVLPVRFSAGSLGAGLPRRDLFVSPLHAMFLDGALIPAALLVNDTTIVQTETVDRVDYIHLELDTHDVIIAEGAASETFIDDGSRGMFHNAAEYAALYPQAQPTPPLYYAPRLEHGERLEAVKLRLASTTLTGAVQGSLDLVTADRIGGWAMAPGGTPISVRITDNDVTLATAPADQFRGDLAMAGIGTGHHAFNLLIPGGLAPGVRHVIDISTPSGEALQNTPWVLDLTDSAAA